LPRLSARLHLLRLIAATLLPVWLFAAYLLVQYAVNERGRFEREALQVARQVSLVVEGELVRLLTVLEGLSKSATFASGDLASLHAEAARLVQGTDRIVLLRDLGRRQLFNTQLPYASELPPAVPLSAPDLARVEAGRAAISEVYASPISSEYRIAIALPVKSPRGENWLLAMTVPTSHIQQVMMPAVPDGWTLGVGDRDGTYVARSSMHAETTGQPGLPEYLARVVGRSGTFTSRNFQNTDLLAGYYRSDFSGWFYAANVPLSVVQAPLWRSLAAIGAIAGLAMLLSAGLAYLVAKGFTRATGGLAAGAEALGHGRPVTPVETTISEFAVISDALVAAERALAERAYELETVLETAPAAVWFTYDPQARQVIRNRFAAELMGLPTDIRKAFGAPDLVIDTVALKDGKTVSREDRPLTRAMRGEQTDNQEFAYILPSGVKRILLTSARPIRDPAGTIIGAVQISLDITERKRGEEQRELLVNELNHRVKNTLAVVQSIASQTLRSATSLPEASRSLISRLVSLGKAHDILTQENWSGADLRDLIVGAVEPHAGLERFELDGGPVRLPSALALSLALAFHELATNALKYGALSVPGGKICVEWSISGPERRLRIEWRERGGPPVAAARRKGFGTRLLERILNAEPAGRVTVNFESDGVVCVFEAALGAPEGAAEPS
jgi:PAS domain S-box-containing protein